MQAIPSGLFFLCATFLDENNGRVSSLGKALPCLGFSAHGGGLGWEWKEKRLRRRSVVAETSWRGLSLFIGYKSTAQISDYKS